MTGALVLEIILAITLITSAAVGIAAISRAQTADHSPSISKSVNGNTATDGSVAFGGTITYKDHMKVTVVSLGLVSTSEYPTSVGGPAALFEITAENISSKDVEGFSVGLKEVTYGDKNVRAFNLLDDKGDLQRFSTILPGKKQTIKVAYDVPAAEAGDVRVEIFMPFAAEKDTIFTGSIK